MVLEEGLDISSLPETLKEDFDSLDRLKGRYRVTDFLVEDVASENLSPRKGPPCSFCTAKQETEKGMKITEDFKPTATFSKVILISIYKVKTRTDIAQGGGGVADVHYGGQVDRVQQDQVHCWQTRQRIPGASSPSP